MIGNFLVLAVILILFILAIKYMMKNKDCCSCGCNKCGKCKINRI